MKTSYIDGKILVNGHALYDLTEYHGEAQTLEFSIYQRQIQNFFSSFVDLGKGSHSNLTTNGWGHLHFDLPRNHE